MADARLHREVAALLRAGLAVEVLGLGEAAAGPPGALVRTWPRGSMAARALRAVRLPWLARGHVLITLDPDVVPAALIAARLRGRPVVADVHEDYVALLVDRAWARRARRPLQVLAGGCVALAGRAALTVVADDHVPPGGSRCRQRLVVRNLPDVALLPAPEAVEPEPALRAVYIGDVRTSRGLVAMVEAIAAAPGWVLDIVGPVAAADQGWLTQRLSAPDLAQRVRLHGRLPPAQAWSVAAGACVGMLLVQDTPAFRAAVPTKLYEYLISGMAVLATPLPRVVPFVADTGAGAIITGDQVGAAAGAQLRAWADDPAALAAARRGALAYADAELRGPNPWDELAAAVARLGR